MQVPSMDKCDLRDGCISGWVHIIWGSSREASKGDGDVGKSSAREHDVKKYLKLAEQLVGLVRRGCCPTSSFLYAQIPGPGEPMSYW